MAEAQKPELSRAIAKTFGLRGAQFKPLVAEEIVPTFNVLDLEHTRRERFHCASSATRTAVGGNHAAQCLWNPGATGWGTGTASRTLLTVYRVIISTTSQLYEVNLHTAQPIVTGVTEIFTDRRKVGTPVGQHTTGDLAASAGTQIITGVHPASTQVTHDFDPPVLLDGAKSIIVYCQGTDQTLKVSFFWSEEPLPVGE